MSLCRRETRPVFSKEPWRGGSKQQVSAKWHSQGAYLRAVGCSWLEPGPRSPATAIVTAARVHHHGTHKSSLRQSDTPTTATTTPGHLTGICREKGPMFSRFPCFLLSTLHMTWLAKACTAHLSHVPTSPTVDVVPRLDADCCTVAFESTCLPDTEVYGMLSVLLGRVWPGQEPSFHLPWELPRTECLLPPLYAHGAPPSAVHTPATEHQSFPLSKRALGVTTPGHLLDPAKMPGRPQRPQLALH